VFTYIYMSKLGIFVSSIQVLAVRGCVLCLERKNSNVQCTYSNEIRLKDCSSAVIHFMAKYKSKENKM